MDAAPLDSTPDGGLEPPLATTRRARLPRLELPWLLLLGVTLALGAWSWLRVQGALFADVVEYLERARAFVRGEEMVDAQQIRAAGVTILHAPALWIADRLGIGEGPWVLTYAALVHLSITVLFVVAAVRLGRSLAVAIGREDAEARAVGWLTGLVALACPTLTQFSAIPMTDIAAGAALACGIERAFLGGPTPRTGAAAGAWLGVAALCAFKAIPIIALTIAAALAVRLASDGARATARLAGVGFVALAALAIVQCTFDLLTYGTFGVGLAKYLLINFGPQAGQLLYEIGVIDLGQWLYQQGLSAIEEFPLEQVSRSKGDFSAISGRTWYLDHFEWFAARWLAPVALLGVGVAVARARRVAGSGVRGLVAAARLGAPILIAAVYAGLTSIKGAKEMRIWLPILPVFAAYTGVGLAALAGAANDRWGRARAAAAAIAVLAAPVQAVVLMTLAPTAPFGAFERAAHWLRDAPRPAADRAPRVAASYHWAVLYRVPPDWELEKLPHQLDQLPSVRDADALPRTIERLRAQDVLFVPTSLLSAPWSEELVDLLANEYHVAAAFWDRRDDTGVGAVLAFTRDVPAGQVRRVVRGRSAAPTEAPGVRLERQLGGDRERMRLAGLRVERLPGDGLYWVEVDLDQRGERLIAGYALGLRVSDATGRRGWTTFRRPDWGKGDVRQWATGTRWTEGFLLAPDQGPLALGQAFEAVQPGQRAHLWFDAVTLGADATGRRIVTGRLEPMDPDGSHAERDDLDLSRGVTDDGWRFAPSHGELYVGSFQVGGDAGDLRLEGALSSQ